jgi:hypothetical protein
MTGWQRAVTWILALVVGLGIAGLGVYVAIINLDRADKIASVAGALLSMAGLGLSTYGIVVARRASKPSSWLGAQIVERVDAGRDVDLVDGVAGSVRLGAPMSGPAAPHGANTSATAGEQTVRDVKAGGRVRLIRGVGGNVDSDT